MDLPSPDPSPAGTTLRHCGLFPPFGRASFCRRQQPRFSSRSSGTALHFLSLNIPLPVHTGSAGHSHRVSPMPFPNASVPAASPAESRRLSERFSSRLCTELQNGLEELVTSMKLTRIIGCLSACRSVFSFRRGHFIMTQMIIHGKKSANSLI